MNLVSLGISTLCYTISNMPKQNEIIVTGVNGFVGEHLARHLQASRFSVTGVGAKPHQTRVLHPTSINISRQTS